MDLIFPVRVYFIIFHNQVKTKQNVCELHLLCCPSFTLLISHATAPCPDSHKPFQPHFSFSNQPLPQSVIAALTVAKRRWQSEFYREKQMPLKAPKFVKLEGSQMGRSLSLLSRQEQVAHGIAMGNSSSEAQTKSLNPSWSYIWVSAKRPASDIWTARSWTALHMFLWSTHCGVVGFMAADTEANSTIIHLGIVSTQ